MRQRNLEKLIDLGDLPFYIAAELAPLRQEFPNQLPFVLGHDPAIDLLIQMPHRRTQQALKKAYCSKGPLGTPMLAEGLGRGYAENFLEFIRRRVGMSGLKNRDLLEVGCGTGYLLTRLCEAGVRAIGVEPGPAGSVAPSSSEIIILNEYLQSCTFDRTFDFVVHFTVAEHMPDPVEFFLHHRKLLGSKGEILFAVPDCTGLHARGDLSFLAHEHWSYFTSTSLTRLAQRTGFSEVHSERSTFGGLIYCHWEIGELIGDSEPAVADSVGQVERARKGVMALQRYFDRGLSDGRCVGVFCPARLQNYYFMLGLAGERVRFFDDDPNLEGRYYPPIDIVIEGRGALLANPVDSLLVFSRPFGVAIQESLRRHPELKSMRVTPICELF